MDRRKGPGVNDTFVAPSSSSEAVPATRADAVGSANVAEGPASPGVDVTSGSDPGSNAQPAVESSGEKASAPETKRAYPAPAEVPTQQGPNGIRFDFNDGCRVVLAE